jgi:hypothetical protein
MPIVRLTGFVTPDIGLTASGGPFTFDGAPIHIEVTHFEFSREKLGSGRTIGKMYADVELADAGIGNIALASHFVIPAMRSVVNAAAFSFGSGATLIIDTAIPPNGDSLPFAHTVPPLRGICTAQPMELLMMYLSERAVHKHLHDLVETLIEPFEAPVNCARAVEGLRK